MEQIREYRIIRKIGEGGMGEVYLAEDENLGRQVAIKMLAPELMRNAELVERFKQEARLQAKLIHPNIVALHTFFVENGKFYMVMEYAEGETLANRIKRVGLIPVHLSIPIFLKILVAVGFAHSNGIIHRDLKPSNIIIDSKNNIKVMDFGIAKIFGTDAKTKTGTKMGTLLYMSPEQIKGELVDNRTDIYALGITLYEMITGKNPFGDISQDSEYLIMEKIINEKLRDPREIYPYIPEWLVEIIYKATEKDKNLRIAKIKDFYNLISKGAKGIQDGATNFSPKEEKPASNPNDNIILESKENNIKNAKSHKWIYILVFLVLIIGLGVIYYSYNKVEIKEFIGAEDNKKDAIFIQGGTFIMGNNNGENNQIPNIPLQ